MLKGLGLCGGEELEAQMFLSAPMLNL